MSSYLHIGKLPYNDGDSDVASYLELKLQFTKGIEIILSLDELGILLQSLFLHKQLKYRALQFKIEDLTGDIDIEEDFYSGYIKESVLSIASDLGYYCRNFKYNEEDLQDNIKNLKEALELFKPDKDEDEQKIVNVIEWAKKYFIEGEHYFYTC